MTMHGPSTSDFETYAYAQIARIIATWSQIEQEIYAGIGRYQTRIHVLRRRAWDEDSLRNPGTMPRTPREIPHHQFRRRLRRYIQYYKEVAFHNATAVRQFSVIARELIRLFEHRNLLAHGIISFAPHWEEKAYVEVRDYEESQKFNRRREAHEKKLKKALEQERIGQLSEKRVDALAGNRPKITFDHLRYDKGALDELLSAMCAALTKLKRCNPPFKGVPNFPAPDSTATPDARPSLWDNGSPADIP